MPRPLYASYPLVKAHTNAGVLWQGQTHGRHTAAAHAALTQRRHLVASPSQPPCRWALRSVIRSCHTTPVTPHHPFLPPAAGRTAPDAHCATHTHKRAHTFGHLGIQEFFRRHRADGTWPAGSTPPTAPRRPTWPLLRRGTCDMHRRLQCCPFIAPPHTPFITPLHSRSLVSPCNPRYY